jgi:hypothetical protein
VASKIEELFARAIPKLAEVEPEKAAALRKKLGRLLAKTWSRGRDHVQEHLGIEVDEAAHEAALDGARAASAEGSVDRFLESLLDAVASEKLFVKLARATAHLAKQRAEEKKDEPAPKRASERVKKVSERLKKAPSERLKKAKSERLKKVSSGRQKALTASSVDDTDDGPSLAVPDEGTELAVPADALDEDAPLRITLEETADPKAELRKLAAPTDKGSADDGPDLAAARALERFRKDGDPAELDGARRLYKEALKAATIAPAKAAARAGLALVALSGGDETEAKRLADEALREDDCCPLAISVAARAARGEGARERLKGAIARARAALSKGDRKALPAIIEELEEKHGDEPFAALVRFADGADRHSPSEDAIAAAWKRYPSRNHPDLALGAGLDLVVAKGAALWALERLEKDDAGWAPTVKDLEKKDNAVAGALQIALGVSRVALAVRSDLTKPEEQELRMASAYALLGLQHFDQSAATFAKARTIDRKTPAGFECSKGEDRCAVMRRAFDKPGIKAKLGSLEGIGLAALKKSLASKLEKLSAEKRPLDEKLGGDETETAKKLAGDATRRARAFEKMKSAGGLDETVTAIAEAEKKLGELSSEQDGLAAKKEKAPEAPAKGGLFGKLAGGLGRALDGAKDLAKGAELKLRRQHVEAKHQEALRNLGKRLRDAPDGGWKDKELDAYVARTRTLEAKLDQLEDEAGQLRKATTRASDL